ncbi:hypothetical protein ASPWEDRAFT_306263 [Aspergillus wentii DTO 134E9]|uniref:Uncharacterized protein n=1 Tax=Aspergillus wentii DTO 134E9 TaxID=1073089 RepID=A0A1L9R3V0_ASPWE|nr:uncharacterized protein ASPWEDRAFT_306263 [Aspergillus wentii DTO 134E9]OJJ29552.1 hypothetical protein ASPWEDRAFT_306263 [Aspergillus wentii DTO 134E9]
MALLQLDVAMCVIDSASVNISVSISSRDCWLQERYRSPAQCAEPIVLGGWSDLNPTNRCILLSALGTPIPQSHGVPIPSPFTWRGYACTPIADYSAWANDMAFIDFGWRIDTYTRSREPSFYSLSLCQSFAHVPVSLLCNLKVLDVFVFNSLFRNCGLNRILAVFWSSSVFFCLFHSSPDSSWSKSKGSIMTLPAVVLPHEVH